MDVLSCVSVVKEYEVEVIVVPAILLFLFVIFLLCLVLLRFCNKKKSSQSPLINNYKHYQINQPLNHQNHHHNHHHDNKHPNHHHDSNHHPNYHHDNRQTNHHRQHQNSSPQRSNRHRSHLQEADKHQFMGFTSFLSGLGPHPFIPALLGVVTVQPPFMMVTEELHHRDLLSFLWKCRQDNAEPGCDMTEKRVYTMARQVASALDYLHSQQCVHGNVAARSVLVGRDLTVKLWGLGSAYRRSERGAGEAEEAMELRKWQAPEVLARNGVTKNSDVWSLGILLYEMITLGDPPFPQLLATELLQYLQRGKFMKKPASCSNALYSLIKSCCQWSPQQRVSVPELIRKLESGERTANGSTVLRVPEPLDVEKYLREAGYGEAYNYAVF
uniref:Protein kinase domain-containing protein n=1 Tax=Periophthalmus magnuspinnatus TaxID=409849 RepID=A0A3B4AP29_9GOBI